nr:type II secretion system F family protein [uncultured Mediterraneibacter sp.]
MAYVFYDSPAAVLLLIPVGIFYMRDLISDFSEKKEEEFRGQFRDSIQAVASALKAGYSVENAIREAKKDMESVYGRDTRIRKEYDRMVHQLDMNMTAGAVLDQLAQRTGQEDVESFVNVFTAAKKSGGDSIAVIRNSVRLISEKIDTEKEIRTMLASQKLEFDIMCAVPFVIILYMKMTFGDFLSVLYETMAGAGVMTVCLLIYLAAYRFGRKIIRIEV